ncbi:MAG: phosphopantetheine-binding protein [Myxococcaceae bacterium]
MKAIPETQQALHDQLKTLLVETLRLNDVKPEDIDSSEPLFAPDNSLGLDSLSALELLSAIEFKFNVVFANDGSARQHFESISTLAAFIESARR